MSNLNPYLEDVKYALGISGNYQDNTLIQYINETVAFLNDMGVSDDVITPGVVSIGVSNLWNYGSEGGKFSEYFKERAIQLAYKK